MDSIKVVRIGAGVIQAGGRVRIIAKIWANTATADFVDFFYANDATAPQWTFIDTLSPNTTGANTLSAHCTLGYGSL